MSKIKNPQNAYCRIPTTDDPVDQATLRETVTKLRARADTLFDAARAVDFPGLDNKSKGHARAFIHGQATAYQRAADMLEALYELPF